MSRSARGVAGGRAPRSEAITGIGRAPTGHRGEISRLKGCRRLTRLRTLTGSLVGRGAAARGEPTASISPRRRGRDRRGASNSRTDRPAARDLGAWPRDARLPRRTAARADAQRHLYARLDEPRARPARHHRACRRATRGGRGLVGADRRSGRAWRGRHRRVARTRAPASARLPLPRCSLCARSDAGADMVAALRQPKSAPIAASASSTITNVQTHASVDTGPGAPADFPAATKVDSASRQSSWPGSGSSGSSSASSTSNCSL